MDHMIYVAMAGAKQTMGAMATVTNNLANVSTTGFRADLLAFTSQEVPGDAPVTRLYPQAAQPGFSTQAGGIVTTGRELDVAVNGSGWIAVQAPDGSEALTRSGSLQIDAGGLLVSSTGHPILGEGGPVSMPPAQSVSIGGDGTISVQLDGASRPAVIDRIRLVNPDSANLVKGDDGLIRTTDGALPDADASVTLTSGALESSNVNAVQALVEMITLSRQYEAQVKLMNAAKENDQTAVTLLRSS